MRRRFSGTLAIFAASISLVCSSAIARGSEFETIVRNFEQESGCRRTHIPFFWLARTVVAVGHPAGTHELKLAVFERPTMEPRQFSEIVDDALGRLWKPMVRVRSQDGEVTSIFLQENGGQTVRLLVANKERDEAMLVEVRLDVGRLLHFLDEHQNPSASGPH